MRSAFIPSDAGTPAHPKKALRPPRRIAKSLPHPPPDVLADAATSEPILGWMFDLHAYMTTVFFISLSYY
jgi:hypothetical protein